MAKPILFIFIYFQMVYLQEIPSPTYDGNTLKYSIALNLTKYLEELTKNNSEIENKIIYNDASDLNGTKTGLVKGTVLHHLASSDGKILNYTLYDNYEEIQQALNNHSIEQFICFKDLVSEQIQMLSENLTYIDYDTGLLDSFDLVFLLRAEETNLYEDIKAYFFDDDAFYDILSNWIGLDDGLKHINTTIDYSINNLSISVILNYPFAYIEDGEFKGYLLDILHRFSNNYNYSLNIISASGSKSVEIVKNKTANVSLSFVRKEVLYDKSFSNIPFHSSKEIVNIIRYDNSKNSTKWKIPNSVSDFNGDIIGVMKRQENLVKQFFPNSQIISNSNPNELINLLLKEIMILY